MARQATPLVNPRVTAAVSHPTRLHAMAVFWEREASPKEVAAELGEPVNNVTYHIKELLELGWIELVAQRPVHGGRVVENLYRATRGSSFHEADLSRLGPEELHILDMTIMDLISRDISQAMLAGTFFEREDNNLIRTPIEVDEEGWLETKQILERTLDDLLEVKERVLQRTAVSGEQTVPTKVEIIHFVSPRPKRDGGGA